MDSDKDERLSFEEFTKSVYDTYKIYVEFESPGTIVPFPEHKFFELDVNNDQYVYFSCLDSLYCLFIYNYCLHPNTRFLLTTYC